jgi:hypothetical protein
LLPFAIGLLVALGVLFVREPALFLEPTLRADDVIVFATQYGDGPVLYHHGGAVHLLQMLSSWMFVHALPENAVPYAYSSAALLLSAVVPATLLLPMLERWLPLFPERGLSYLLLVALPLDAAGVLASFGYQHLNYLLITFVLLAFSCAPRAGPWFELQSPLRLSAFCAVFAACMASAPLSIALVPMPLYTLLASPAHTRFARQQWFALFALLGFALYAAFGMKVGDAFFIHAGVFSEPRLGLFVELGQRVTLALLERVFFETFFGTSSRLWLSNGLGARWAVVVLGLASIAFTIAVLVRSRRSGASRGAGFALYAALAVPALALLSRWPEANLDFWQAGTLRYFIPAAKLLVIQLVITVAPVWTIVRRKRLVTAALVAWIAALNLADNVRYAGPLFPVVTQKSPARLDGEVLRAERRAETRYAYEQLATIVRLGRTLPHGESRAHTFPLWGGAVVVVHGTGLAAP